MKNLLKIVFVTITLASTSLLTSAFASAENKVEMSEDSKMPVHNAVYINLSTIEELITLKGVGKSKAQAIISYRNQFGDFKNIDDLTNVKGIGVKVIKDNKSRLKI